MFGRIITGLDIGTHSIKIVQLRRISATNAVLVNYGIFPVGELLVNGMQEDEKKKYREHIIELLKKIITEQKIRITNLVTAIPKQFATVRYITLPSTDPIEIKQMVPYEAQKHIPFLSEEDIVDFQLLSTSPLGTSEVLLVVVKRVIIDDYLSLLNRAHLMPEVVDVSTLAISNLLQFSGFLDSNKAYISVDIGAQMTDLTLITNGILRETRSTPIAGNQLIRGFTEEFKATMQEIESMLSVIDLEKENYGVDSVHALKVEKAIRPWLERFISELRRSIEYFIARANINKIDSILLSGGLAQMKGLPAYLVHELGISTRLVNPFEKIQFPLRKNKFDKETILPQLAVAAGLALRQINGAVGAGVNLLPPQVLGARVRKKLVRSWVVTGTLAGIATLSTVATGYRIYSERVNRLEQITKEIQRISALSERLSIMRDQIDRVKTIFLEKEPLIETLSYLSSLEFIPSRVTLTKIDYTRNRLLLLQGTALEIEDVFTLRTLLDKSQIFENVTLKDTRIITMEGQQVQEFVMECKIKPSKRQLRILSSKAKKTK